MSTSTILRTACGLLLFLSISSFAGCDKSGDAHPRSGKDCNKTTTTAADSTSTGGAS
ncbi:hypothetical protein [Hymenobacter sp. BT491]|uniref:hypothetical protein n=1 Tax=Hymenobacter sp. BT491 TaxID=2766779 RepID=UPI001653C2C1|nr:hypothetical protein [Hymenobacter sp. BT491]MBC6992525.1 hypothetical protein [Hymenobacter sp. BT491]